MLLLVCAGDREEEYGMEGGGRRAQSGYSRPAEEESRTNKNARPRQKKGEIRKLERVRGRGRGGRRERKGRGREGESED